MQRYDVTLPRWANDGAYIQRYGGMSAVTDCEHVFNTLKHV